MAFLELLGDEPHDGGPGIDDKVALPGGEEVGPAASHVKPAERLQRLSRASVDIWTECVNQRVIGPLAPFPLLNNILEKQ